GRFDKPARTHGDVAPADRRYPECWQGFCEELPTTRGSLSAPDFGVSTADGGHADHGALGPQRAGGTGTRGARIHHLRAFAATDVPRLGNVGRWKIRARR